MQSFAIETDPSVSNCARQIDDWALQVALQVVRSARQVPVTREVTATTYKGYV